MRNSSMDKKIQKHILDKLDQIDKGKIKKNTQEQKIELIIKSNLKRLETRPHKARPIINNSSIFISGGIGDVLAIESFMSDQQRKNITTIFYGTKKQPFIELIFSSLPNFENLKNHVVVWDDFSNFPCFFRKYECISKLMFRSQPQPEQLISSEDFGITSIFAKIKSGIMQFCGSSVFKYELAKINHFNLPISYFVVCPFSTDKTIKTRDFDFNDWSCCMSYLNSKKIQGIVLNHGDDIVPNDPQLINLTNQTTLIESFEILKQANGYIGVDSCLSVLAAQLFEYPNLLMKSNSEHCYENLNCYYPKQNKLDFINHNLESFILYI